MEDKIENVFEILEDINKHLSKNGYLTSEDYIKICKKHSIGIIKKENKNG